MMPRVAVGWALGGNFPPQGCLGHPPGLWWNSVFPMSRALWVTPGHGPASCIMFPSRTGLFALTRYQMLVSGKRQLVPWLEFLLYSPLPPRLKEGYLLDLLPATPEPLHQRLRLGTRGPNLTGRGVALTCKGLLLLLLTMSELPTLEKGMATHSSILAWRIPWT